ncbi:hypothetical protein JI735_19735 [Paenibacillus sonchi]|uniref:Uncharacterized protein n=1 Tax=Paenibacillus sonchi TaxID=373687 RepID=A0A974SBB0_9BACL|nr:hypothetical protein [Paenibacillus sonchi]MCE3203414.1 hypothetical protein [Paenibacillus sonchi]QQZ58961.1 hypothetical protein JI735_19735 [Paenibacillus sonchi]
MEGKAFMEHWTLISQVLREHIELNKVRYSQHSGERMQERRIAKREVESVLYHFSPSEMHAPFRYPFGESPYTNEDPVLTITGQVESGRIAIGLAIKMRRNGLLFSVITVIRPEHGRHM